MKYINTFHKLIDAWPLIIIGLIAIIIIYIILKVVFRLRAWRSISNRKTVSLEITPPLTKTKSAHANQELINILYGFRASRSFKDKLFKRDVVIGLQIISTREYGIRFIIKVDKNLATSLVRAINSHLPEVKVKEIRLYISKANLQVVEFKLTGHYAFPLAESMFLEDHDPISYITGMMSNLSDNEQLSYQLILTPVKLKEASHIAHRILRNEDLLYHLNDKKLPFISSISDLLSKSMFGITDMIGEVYHGTTKNTYDTSYGSARQNYERLQIAKRQRPSRTLSAFELEVMESIHRKVNQPLFRVNIRASVSMENTQEASSKLDSITTALQTYNQRYYQSLKTSLNFPPLNNLHRFEFINQLPGIFKRSVPVLSSSEVASLYHFPVGVNTKTDNLVTSLSRTLAAPISLKQNNKLDLIIGENEHHGIKTAIGLTEADRERHIYMIGGTGNGKTTMLQYSIVQDMENGKSLAIIDPHGDMAETMLKYVPKNRINDVVYFNPDDIKYPIGLNLLELSKDLDEEELLKEKDLITESVISIFRKIFSEEDTGGHRIEYVLRNTIQTALTVPNATLFTIFDLLNDPDYRKSVIKTLDSKELKNFWKYELGKAGEMQKVKMSAGITAKIGRFLFSATAKRILEQPKSTIDFEEIINSGKILICNLSKGLIGEDTSELFGITILAKLQLASLKRARLKQSERQPFYLYVDEFQNFATQSFVQMLSESRKYKLFMTMAEQSTSQQKDQQMVNIILANVGTVICFRTGNPQDERLLLPLFKPFVEDGEISNLMPFNFYTKLSAVISQEPMSGRTILLADKGSEEIADRVIDLSRNNYTKKYLTEKPKESSTQQTPKVQKTKTANEPPDEKMLDLA